MPFSPAFDRDTYHIDGQTDLQVEREQALMRQKGGTKLGKKPEGTLLHFHDAKVPRTDCNKYNHELYETGHDGVQLIPAAHREPNNG